MKIAEIGFLNKEEAPPLPRWTGILTDSMLQKYILKHKPFVITEEGGRLQGTLSLQQGATLTSPWRERAEDLLTALAEKGAAIVIPPYEGEFPRKILPFAEGKVLTKLFAFDAAAEALRRQGKNPAECSFLLSGTDEEVFPLVLAGMGDYVNRLTFYTDHPALLSEVQEELFIQRGLLCDVFSSPKNPMFAEADCVIVCSMEQTGYEHILKRHTVFLDVAGNRPALRRVMERRWDVAAAEGFFFSVDEKQEESRMAEALAFINYNFFSDFWLRGYPADEATGVLAQLKEQGLHPSGFSALGKRVKIAKYQG